MVPAWAGEDSAQMQRRIGFIGAGQMATALASGLIRAGLATTQTILASDVLPTARQRFVQVTGAAATDENLQVLQQSHVVFLAVKPQQLPEVCKQLRGHLTPEKLVVSIAAGIGLASLSDWLGGHSRLVRVMPNTPCLIGHGASAFAVGKQASAEDAQLVQSLLSAVGLACQVEEKLIDAVTGLSGSGPAFVYVMIEALGDAGVRAGLPRELASKLAAQTVRGAAEMVLATGEHPAVLKDRVASPGGTTIEGLAALEAGGLRATIMAAVERAVRRATELGAQWVRSGAA